MCIFLMDDVDEILQVLFIGIAVASVLLQTGRFIKALELFSECLVLLKKYSLKLEICKLNELFALVYDRLVNLFCFVSEQRENFESLLLKANTRGKEIIAGFLHRLGGVSLSRFEHSKANDYFERAGAVFQETGNRKKELDVFIDLGNLYKENEEYQKAKVYYEKAMLIAEDVGGTYEKGVAYGKLGTLCNILGEYAKAKELHRKALEISVRLGDKEGEITDHLNFAKVHINLSEYDQARECYRKALEISTAIGSQEAEASTCLDLGVFSCSLSDYENAEFYVKK